MIIKGGARPGGRGLARHLGRTDTNETVQLLDVRGTAATDLDGSFREIEAVASGTRCKKPLYHASINTARDEVLTPEQWRQSVDTLEKALGLADQPRAVVRHVKDGREHVHVVWSRIDAENMKAISDSHNYRIHEEVSRQLEREFGHERVEGVHTGDKSKDRPIAEASHGEKQQGERTGLTDDEVKAVVRAAWQKSENGTDFAAELADAGYVLARGDRRDMVILDSEGGVHSPRRRLGLKAAEVKARCADLDPASLPSIAEGKALIHARDKVRTPEPGDNQAEGESIAPPANAPEKDQAPKDQAKDTPPAAAEKQPAEKTADSPAPAGASPAQDIDRSDGEPTISGGSGQKPAGKKQGEEMESPGILSLIFAKVTGLFDFMRQTLFAAAFAPTVEKENQPAAPEQEPEAQQITGQPIAVQPDRPRPLYKPFDPSKIVLPVEKEIDARERDAEDGRGQERTREWQPPPDDEPGGGET